MKDRKALVVCNLEAGQVGRLRIQRHGTVRIERRPLDRCVRRASRRRRSLAIAC